MPKEEKRQPPQQGRRAASERKLKPHPKAEDNTQRGSGKLQGEIAIITGGDSGIGRAIAIAFAKEGADVSVVYLEEHRDAKETEQLVEQHGRKCLLIDGDVGDEKFCAKVVDQTLSEFGRIDTLGNNAAGQHPQDSIEKISPKLFQLTDNG
jgi:NAD(P)-dependent dehydrogenase (short-subunit alcohol dehydrogenase family)